MKSVRLIVDGSALGNLRVGGWACIMQYQASERGFRTAPICFWLRGGHP